MNLKLVVASMSILGLVSCPVFAATDAKTKHHHKKMMRHQVVEHEQEHERAHEHEDYKGMRTAPEVCSISETAMIMDQTTQSIGRSMPNPCNPGWFNRLQFAGGINVDLGKFGNRNANYMGENYQRFSLNDAYLNIAAVINPWAKAFASIDYSTATINDPVIGTAEYSSAYSNNITGSLATSTLQLEQAYAVFGNFDESPIYLQVGKSFQDFSRYEIHPITRTMTQVVSEILTTSAKLGFIAEGFSGGIYAFDDPLAKVGHTSNTTNYGVALGYEMPSDAFGFAIGAAYLYNMIGVNDVAYIVNQYNGGAFGFGGYNTRVGAAAGYLDLNSGPFVVDLRYTTALQRFNILDLPKDGLAPSTKGAKPWAAGITAAYGFEGWDRNQSVYLGYQASREAAGLNLPKSRWVVGYTIDWFGKNTNLALEWDNDRAYSVSNGGTGNNTNLVTIRTGVKFG